MIKGARGGLIRRAKMPTEGLLCNYPHRVCMQSRMEGHEFCAHHLLEDKNVVTKQCSYTSAKTNRRCTMPTARTERRDSLCVTHARRSHMARQRAMRKRRPQESCEGLLQHIEHYANRPGPEGDTRRKARTSESFTQKLLEYATSSDSDDDPVLIEQSWRGDANSDADSMDSEQEDPLKHAGVYTAEEVALMTRDKLIRLQALYIEQFKRLQYLLREKRRKYLLTSHTERETHGGLHYAKEDPELRNAYDQLEALKKYHKRYGKEALMHRQSKERRIAVTEGSSYRPPAFPKCIFVHNNERCANRTIPLSKFCFDHVLHDPHQVLFIACGHAGGGCGRPVVVGQDIPRCRLHAILTPFLSRLPCQTLINVQGPSGLRRSSEPTNGDGMCGLAGRPFSLPDFSSSQQTQDSLNSSQLSESGNSQSADESAINAFCARDERPMECGSLT